MWLGPELWNATPQRTLRYVTEAAAASEPLFRHWPDSLTFCVGNELTAFMRGIVPGRSHAQRSHASGLAYGPSRRGRSSAAILSPQDLLAASDGPSF